MSLAVALGVMVGLVLGLTGAGGSIFAVPLLMWGLGWSLPQAVPVALLAVCAAAAFGTLVAWDVSFVRYRAAILMSVAGTLVAPFGLRAAHALPVPLLTGLFAAVLVIVAIRMIRQARRSPQEAAVVRATVAGDAPRGAGPACRLDPDTGRIVWTKPCALAVSGAGAVTGFLSGLLGVGGGFVIVPALRAFTEMSIHSAVATSLMAIALTSAGTVAAALWQGQHMPWLVALPFVAGSLLGMLAGRRLAPRVSGARLQQVFAFLMFLVAAVLLAQSASAI